MFFEKIKEILKEYYLELLLFLLAVVFYFFSIYLPILLIIPLYYVLVQLKIINKKKELELLITGKENELSNIKREALKRERFFGFIINVMKIDSNKKIYKYFLLNLKKIFPVKALSLIYVSGDKLFSIKSDGERYLGNLDEFSEIEYLIKKRIAVKDVSYLADYIFGKKKYKKLYFLALQLDKTKYYIYILDMEHKVSDYEITLFFDALSFVYGFNSLKLKAIQEEKVKKLIKGIFDIFMKVDEEEKIIESASHLLKQFVVHDDLNIYVYDEITRKLKPLFNKKYDIKGGETIENIVYKMDLKILNDKKNAYLTKKDFQNIGVYTPINHFLALPLYFKEKLIGVFNIIRYRDIAYSELDFFVVDIFVKMLSAVLDKIIYLKKQEYLANYDGLTKIYTRVAFMKRCEHELARYKRYGGSFALLMVDIDHFKKVNDTYGHQAGDYVLFNVVRVIKKTIRETDLLGRYGGEEFVVFLQNISSELLISLAERIRKNVEMTNFVYEGKKIDVTISIGVSFYPLDGNSLDKLLKKADIALYYSKENGRNKVTLFHTIKEG